MDESYYREKLSAYFDKSLSPEEMAMMDKYVQESEEARKILEEYQKLEHLIEEKSQLGGDDDYWERSAQRIEQAVDQVETTPLTPVRPKFRSWFWKAVPIAASIMLLTFIGLHQTDIFGPEDISAPEGGKEVMEFGPPPSATPVPDAVSTTGDTVDFDREIEEQPRRVIMDTGPAKPTVDEADYQADPRIGIPKPVPDDELGGSVARRAVEEEVPELSPPVEELAPIVDKRERSPDQSASTAEKPARAGRIQRTTLHEIVPDSATVAIPAEDDVVEDIEVPVEEEDYYRRDASARDVSVQKAKGGSDEPERGSPFDDGDYRSQKDEFLGMLSALPQHESSDTDTEVPQYTKDELDSLLVHHRKVKERMAVLLAEDNFKDTDHRQGIIESKKSSLRTTASETLPQIELKRQLYESSYYVALATEDQEEFLDAITILDECARDYSDPHRNLARDYLDMLNRYLEDQH